MKRTIMAMMLGTVVGGAMGADGPGGVALAVDAAIADGRLSVLGTPPDRGPNASNAWGMVRIAATTELDGRSVLTGWQRGDDSWYFYPASTIKIYAAVAAFEVINELSRTHPDAGLSEDTPLRIFTLGDDGPVRDMDPTHTTVQSRGIEPGPLTTAREVHKVFVVSDNDAFNNLYDLVGPEGLNHRMASWGVRSSWISHRLAIARTPDENRRAPKVEFGRNPVIATLPARTMTEAPGPGLLGTTARPPRVFLRAGRGYLRDGQQIDEPFAFDDKNFSTLGDLQLILARLVRPDLTHSGGEPLSGRPLDLTDAQRAKLIASATMLPRESASPEYDPAAYPDDHVKFLLPGLLRVRPLEEWRVVNKIGLAYGFVTENAYVEHVPTGRSVFVAAVIHRNPNGIYNDNQYDYETTLAEMATLGEVVGRALVDGVP